MRHNDPLHLRRKERVLWPMEGVATIGRRTVPASHGVGFALTSGSEFYGRVISTQTCR